MFLVGARWGRGVILMVGGGGVIFGEGVGGRGG